MCGCEGGGVVEGGISLRGGRSTRLQWRDVQVAGMLTTPNRIRLVLNNSSRCPAVNALRSKGSKGTKKETLGSTSDRPANGCRQIKRHFPGWYNRACERTKGLKPRKQNAFENNEETQKLKTEKHVTSSQSSKKKTRTSCRK